MAPAKTYNQHLRAILILGLPLIGSHLAQMAIHTTDVLMIGWYGVPELAALTIASALFFVIFIVGSGFAFAVMPLVAEAHASNDEVQMRRVTRMGCWASIVYGAVFIPLLWWSEAILLGAGQQPEVASFAQDYLRIAIIGMVPALIVMTLKSFLAGLERTAVILWITLIALGMNALINYALIFGNFGAPSLGIRGAAIASIFVEFATLAALCVYIHLKLPEYNLFQNLFGKDTEALMQVIRIGWPIGLTMLAETGLFVASATMMGWIGTNELAAHGIAMQWASITFMIHLGFSNAATIRAGNALGRKDQVGLRRGAATVTILSLLVSLIVAAIFVIYGKSLIGVFLDAENIDAVEIIQIGALLLIMAALFQLTDCFQVVSLALLRGLQDTKAPMVIAAISYWGLGIPCSFILGITLGWGAVGIWTGLVIGLTLASVLLGYRFWFKTGFISSN